MAKIFPVGTRFLTSGGMVMEIVRYSGTEVRAYCQPVSDTKILIPPPGKRGGLTVMGGRLAWRGGVTDRYFEPHELHRERVIRFDENEAADQLNARLIAANLSVEPLLTQARQLREQADRLEEQARDQTYTNLDINLD